MVLESLNRFTECFQFQSVLQSGSEFSFCSAADTVFFPAVVMCWSASRGRHGVLKAMYLDVLRFQTMMSYFSCVLQRWWRHLFVQYSVFIYKKNKKLLCGCVFFFVTKSFIFSFSDNLQTPTTAPEETLHLINIPTIICLILIPTQFPLWIRLFPWSSWRRVHHLLLHMWSSLSFYTAPPHTCHLLFAPHLHVVLLPVWLLTPRVSQQREEECR